MSQALTQADLQHFAGVLRGLVRRATRTRDRIEDESLAAGAASPDAQGDEGTEDEFDEVDVDVLELEDETARAAVAALKRIADGTYGRCNDCGGWIARDRLEAVPTTTLCASCKGAEEDAST